MVQQHRSAASSGGAARPTRRAVVAGAGLAALAVLAAPATAALAQGMSAAPAALGATQSGTLAGSTGGAYASYLLANPDGALTLTLTYTPLLGSRGNGIALEVYQGGAKIATATDTTGSGTLTLPVTPTGKGPLLVKVGNYLAGVVISYTLTAPGVGAAAPAPTPAATAPAGPAAPGTLGTTQSGTLAGASGGAYASYLLASPDGSFTLTLTYSPLLGSRGNGIALEAYQGGAKIASATDTTGSGRLVLPVTPSGSGPLLIKVGNYLSGVTVSYTLTRA